MSNTPTYRRGQPAFLLVGTLIALLLSSAPVTVPATDKWIRDTTRNSLEYKQEYGHWDVIDIPSEFRMNTIHAATLPTGKVLLVAGSGNNRDRFNDYTNEGNISVLATAIFDPDTNKMKLVKTPSDLFCSGHAFLQTGNLLVAGGTSGYELLEGDVTKPAGTMMIYNEDPDSAVKTFKKGTQFISPAGKVYALTHEVKINPATKMDHGDGHVMIHRSEKKVFVEALTEDASSITSKTEQYAIKGLKGTDKQNIYGQGGPMTLSKQDYRGDNKAYEFDPIKEEYIAVGDMNQDRWYPSLPVMANGDVLAVSGLDAGGQITATTEVYSPLSKSWTYGPDRPFPTYPALFRTQNPDVLFFSGSSSGYGPADSGRQPGFWNTKTNAFDTVGKLRDSHLLETSASVMLPPAKGSNDGSQSQRIMVAGGGGIGESPLTTARTDSIDLAAPDPTFTPGPDLPQPTRYPNMTVTPWDEVFATGGSTDYRAKGNSYSHNSYSINPTTNTLQPLADELIGRTYHSGALLLRDGRILVFGGDPLFSDKDNTIPGLFEQRLELFTPPQFYRGERPALDGPQSLESTRGETLTFNSVRASDIKTARLIPPSSTTHVTNIEQRSVGAVVKQNGTRQVQVEVPSDKNLLPKGWYMLFVVDGDDRPSIAKMVYIKE